MTGGSVQWSFPTPFSRQKRPGGGNFFLSFRFLAPITEIPERPINISQIPIGRFSFSREEKKHAIRDSHCIFFLVGVSAGSYDLISHDKKI